MWPSSPPIRKLDDRCDTELVPFRISWKIFSVSLQQSNDSIRRLDSYLSVPCTFRFSLSRYDSSEVTQLIERRLPLRTYPDRDRESNTRDLQLCKQASYDNFPSVSRSCSFARETGRVCFRVQHWHDRERERGETEDEWGNHWEWMEESSVEAAGWRRRWMKNSREDEARYRDDTWCIALTLVRKLLS